MNLNSFFEGPIAEFIFKVLLPLVFVQIIPNSWFSNIGKGLGITTSKTLNKLTFNLWEFIEDHIIGSLISFVNGFKDGANIDDVENKSIWKNKK